MSPLDRIAGNLALLPEILEEYEQLIAEDVVMEKLAIKGKVLEHVAREHSSEAFYYNVRKAEMYSIVKWLEAKMSAVRGSYFKKYTENYSRELPDRTKDKYIDNEKEVLDAIELYLSVKEIHEKYVAVSQAFTDRGYQIRNITELRIRSLEDSLID